MDIVSHARGNPERKRSLLKPFAISGKISFFCLVLYTVQSFFPAQGTANSLRSFDELFPKQEENRKKEIFSQNGFIRSVKVDEALELLPKPNSRIDLLGAILKTNPSYLAESLLVIPYSGKTLDRLDAYNALGKVRDLKGRLYHSHSRNSEVALFEDATRIESPQKNNPIPDPRPSRELPNSETVYIRLKDVNFGNCFYRADMYASPQGVTYNLTNTRNISYLLFTVMKEGKFSASLYLEPLSEGMLIYSMAGADSSDFISNRIDIPSAISKRLAVFIGWISDGLKAN